MTVMCPFSLVLVINGEKATLETPTFAQKRRRTLDMLIRSLYQDLMPDLHKVPGFPFSLGGSGEHCSSHEPWGKLSSYGTCCLDCPGATTDGILHKGRVVGCLCERTSWSLQEVACESQIEMGRVSASTLEAKAACWRCCLGASAIDLMAWQKD